MNCVCCEPPWRAEFNQKGPPRVTHRLYSASGPPAELWWHDHQRNAVRVRADSENSVYVTGGFAFQIPTAGVDNGVVTTRKFNGAGTELWSLGTAAVATTGLDVDDNGDVYTGPPLAKHDTDGELQWIGENAVSGPLSFAAGGGLALMGDHVYSIARPGGFDTRKFLCKHSKLDGSLVWQVLACNRLNEDYVVARDDLIWVNIFDLISSGNAAGGIAQFDPDGLQNWKRHYLQQLIGTSGIAVDSRGHCFQEHPQNNTPFPGYQAGIVEFDLDGAPVHTNTDPNAFVWDWLDNTLSTAIYIDDDDNVYIGRFPSGWQNRGLSTGDGSLQWGMTWEGQVRDIAQSPAGNFVACSSGALYVGSVPT